MFYDNAIVGIQMMEAARQAGVQKFVAIGTICAYPKNAEVPFKEDHLWDGYPDESHAPYALAKKMLLVQAQAYRQQYGFNAIYLLPVNMYGPGDNFHPDSSHVVAALIKKVYDAKRDKKEFIEVWGTGEPTRGFLYVEDGAEGIALACERYDKPDPVNLGSQVEVSIKDLVSMICDSMDYHGEIRWNASKPNGQMRRRLDVERAKREFGFSADTDFTEGLKKTIAWYQKHSL
jgi:GDP-L-fucose synthase